MDKMNEQYAYFTIVNSFNPSEIARQVGIEPSESWRKGDLHPTTHQPRPFSRWSIFSRLSHKEELEKHIVDVLDQLDKNQEGFKRLSEEYGGCMQLVAYFRRGFPGLHFNQDVIERLNNYGLNVDLDFHFPNSDRPANP